MTDDTEIRDPRPAAPSDLPGPGTASDDEAVAVSPRGLEVDATEALEAWTSATADPGPAPGPPPPEVDAGESPAPDGGVPPSMEADPFTACRYLVAASGGWRASDAIRDHRCAALDPPSPIALEKQRRLCLIDAHTGCPTYIAAREERGRALDPVSPAWSPVRPIVRTSPVVLGSPTRERPIARAVSPARLGEAALAVMAAVVVILLGARLLGGSGVPESSPIAGAGATGAPTPAATPAATVSSAPATPGPSPSQGPTARGPAGATAPPPASSAPTAEASARPSASPVRRYTVKRGDTLSAIAAKYGTTVSAIVKRNKIKDPRTIHAGQVLVIP